MVAAEELSSEALSLGCDNTIKASLSPPSEVPGSCARHKFPTQTGYLGEDMLGKIYLL